MFNRQKIEAGMKSRNLRVIKFLISGGTAAIVEYGLFGLLNHLSVNILIANTVSFLTGAIVSFLLNKLWVFRSSGNSGKQLVSYMTLAGINVVLSNAAVLALTSGAGLVPLLAKLITMISIACLNYVLFSKIIFRKPIS